jgi:hypothetical protein
MSRPQPLRPFVQTATARPLTLVSPASRDVVYLEESTPLEVITAALEAWGLRVRQERDATGGDAKVQAPPSSAPVSWETTRPDQSAPCRLDNALSPMWLPIREPVVGNEPVVAFAWFGRAA